MGNLSVPLDPASVLVAPGRDCLLLDDNANMIMKNNSNTTILVNGKSFYERMSLNYISMKAISSFHWFLIAFVFPK